MRKLEVIEHISLDSVIPSTYRAAAPLKPA